MGPKAVPGGQFDQGQAIANSWKEQLLFNVAVLTTPFQRPPGQACAALSGCVHAHPCEPWAA